MAWKVLRLNCVEFGFVWLLFYFSISKKKENTLVRKELLVNVGNGVCSCDVNTGTDSESYFLVKMLLLIILIRILECTGILLEAVVSNLEKRVVDSASDIFVISPNLQPSF
jgi:hypothetical protein